MQRQIVKSSIFLAYIQHVTFPFEQIVFPLNIPKSTLMELCIRIRQCRILVSKFVMSKIGVCIGVDIFPVKPINVMSSVQIFFQYM